MKGLLYWGGMSYWRQTDEPWTQAPYYTGNPMKSMERVKGIEPSSQAWEARILPLNHTRFPLR